MVKRIMPVILLLAGCDQFALPSQSKAQDSSTPPEDTLAGSSIVEEEYLSCYLVNGHYSGMEIVFTRSREANGEKWFADGLPVIDQKTTANLISGGALYTEFEDDQKYTVVDLPYTFRLDYVKGDIDVWTTTRYGKEAGEGRSWRFDGNCTAYEAPMTR
jgi:hypothetical protein